MPPIISELLKHSRKKFQSLKSYGNEYLGPVLVISIVIGTLWYYFRASPSLQEDPNFLDVARVFGSLILSALLVTFYIRVSQVQDQQAKIQDNQTKIMASNLRPVINVNDIDIADDRIGFKIENIGNGIALDPAVTVHLLCYDSVEVDHCLLSYPNERNLLTDSEGTVSDIPSDGDSEVTELFSKVYTKSITNPSLDRSLSQALQVILEENDFDQLYFQIEISYDHMMMVEHDRARKYLQPYRAPLENHSTMETIWEEREEASDAINKFIESDDYPFMEKGQYFSDRD